ncbi:MAG: hypothetical protein ABI568_03190 [Pseudarthrobacter sp.]
MHRENKGEVLWLAARSVRLPPDNAQATADLTKIRDGKRLSPILMVRGHLASGAPAQVADGYHPVCASYYTDENTDIQLKLAHLPK